MGCGGIKEGNSNRCMAPPTQPNAGEESYDSVPGNLKP